VVYSPLLLAELRGAGGASEIPLDAGFEHLVLVAEGRVDLAGTPLAAGEAASLPAGATSLEVTSDAPFTALLLGGAPFEEPILMSWNWVVRTAAEAQEARERWAAGEGHGDLGVFGSRPRISAPPLVGSPVAR
jgi:redox-sensitive bicupin YhaK (pirin superfamily)